jgi:hypothetical protein
MENACRAAEVPLEESNHRNIKGGAGYLALRIMNLVMAIWARE